MYICMQMLHNSLHKQDNYDALYYIILFGIGLQNMLS